MKMFKKYANLAFVSILLVTSVPTYTMDEATDIEQVEAPVWGKNQQRDYAIIGACIVGFCVILCLRDVYSTGKEPSAELLKAVKSLRKRIWLNAKR